jgi:predicted DNA binding protein
MSIGGDSQLNDCRRTLLHELTDGRVTLTNGLEIVGADAGAVELLDASKADLAGENFLTYLGQGQTAVKNALRTITAGSPESLTSLQTNLWTDDGDRTPVKLTVCLLEPDGLEVGITSLREAEANRRSLNSIYELSRQLLQTRNDAKSAQHALTAIIRGTDFVAGGVYLYDAEEERLRLVCAEGKHVRIGRLEEVVSPGETDVWAAFESEASPNTDARHHLGPLSIERDTLTTAIGPMGVLVAFVDEDKRVGLDDFEHADGVVSSLRAALNRNRTEQQLNEQRRKAQQQSTRLRKLSRLNGITRDVNRTVVDATDVSDLYQEIPARLSETYPYKASWYGSYNPGTEEILPRAYAGELTGLPDPISLADAGEGAFISEAIDAGEPVVSHGIGSRAEWDRTRRSFVGTGLDVAIAIPATYQGFTFGVFVVYAEPTDVEERELRVISELGSVAGYAIASESSRSLSQTDEQIRLKLLVKGTRHPLVEAFDGCDAQISVEYLRMEADGHTQIYVRVAGPDRLESLDRLRNHEQVSDVTAVTNRDDEDVYKVQLEDDLLRAASALHLKIAGAHVDQRGLILSVDVAPELSPRSVVDPLSRHVDELQVLAKETVPKSGGSVGRMSALVSQIMTKRQFEVLECAYDAGFFEWPREQSAEEVASRLGITQPTFSEHLRTAERHILKYVFESSGQEL